MQDKNDFSSIKIADFGLSAKYNFSKGALDNTCGTLTYMAPEIVMDQEYTK